MLQQPPAEIQILHEVVILYFAILVSEEKNGVLVKFWSLGVVIHGKCIETRLAGGVGPEEERTAFSFDEFGPYLDNTVSNFDCVRIFKIFGQSLE